MGRELQIDDPGICRLLGVDGEVQSPADPLVAPDRPEGGALGEGCALDDLDALDRGRRRRYRPCNRKARPQEAQQAAT